MTPVQKPMSAAAADGAAQNGLDAARLDLAGSLGLEEVPRLKDEALELLNHPGNLAINLERVERMHATVFQLLFALAREKRERGGELVLEGATPACVQAEAERLGVDPREFEWLFGASRQ